MKDKNKYTKEAPKPKEQKREQLPVKVKKLVNSLAIYNSRKRY